jgi:Mce-associated membrane protein
MTASTRPGPLWWTLVSVLLAGTILAVVLGGSQMTVKNRAVTSPSDQVAARQEVVDAATNATVKILSYTPETVEQNASTAEALLTGEFLEYYVDFVKKTVVPTAREKQVSTTATVVRAGVVTLGQSAASVLVYVNQTTTAGTEPPTNAASAVRVGLQRIDGDWRVDAFDPI